MKIVKALFKFLGTILPRFCSNVDIYAFNKKGYQIVIETRVLGVVVDVSVVPAKELLD